MTGLLITLEGVEGAGKSTQLGLLHQALQERGYRVLAVREPGGEPVAEAIRNLLLSASSPVVPRAELLLFVASRAQLVERVVRPALASGSIVLCDRYIDSTIAYQGYARQYDLEWVRRLNDFATGGLMPDRTILLDLPVEVGLARQTDCNRMEAESLDFHRRVREGYLAEARRDPHRFQIIDAARPPAVIHADILASLLPLLKPEAKP